ncbi:NACHT domain-containing protein [Leptothoe sp. PORK10 BA2]|uniref:NACHT domain-containing protein n=1 Tax=Leptothoe sp. PORK10 BA2 TaxID=3110254 RepID=UPI002B204590|nr:NACHT domain-containing protein [Leptothoe sp. PORK10 BA2]MEA5464452.1 NACHT domain-containing protein [Leptothoe sp. PORK10 BA2]
MHDIPYQLLTLKTKYREHFLKEAKSRFRRGYIKGVWKAINEGLDYEESTLGSDDTVRRILTVDGHSGLADNVYKVCAFFGKDWYEACIEGDHEYAAETCITKICQKVEADLLSGQRKLSGQRLSQKLKHNFIELFLIEVDALPSEYPPIADPNVIADSSNLTEEDFDRIGVQLLRGNKREIKEVIDNHGNIFIYGDPGSGKTTCLQWIALKCCQGEILQGFAPIFIGPRSFATITNEETLQDCLNRMFDQCKCSTTERHELLDSGQAVFIFDGIDEIASESRQRMEANIARLLQDYPQCRFIFSSRLGRKFPFSDDFQKAIIAPLQRGQIRKFIENWFAQPGKDKTLAPQLVRKLQSKAYRGIRELSQRPILLDLLCVVFEHNADIPHKRFDVFRKGIDLMTRKDIVIEGYGPVFQTLRELDVQNMLCKIGSNSFLKCQIIFPTQDVERTIQSYYETSYKVNRTLIPSRQILQEIEQSNGLLVRWADNFCTFSHLTYQEYFTAYDLVENNGYQEVYKHLEQPRWYFVIGLIAECLAYERLWQFFCEFKLKIDSIISNEPTLIAFLEKVEKRSKATAELLDSKQPNIEIYARAWYFAYALKDTGNVTNTGAIYRHFDLPDFEFATSMIDGTVLQTHECVYKIYHSFEQSDEKPQAFVNALHRLEQLLSYDYQNAEVVRGWLERIRQQQDKFDSSNEWWQQRRDGWKECITRFMEKLHLPCAVDLTQKQQHTLHTYYNVTKLFSTCMTRSRLDDLQRDEVIDSMLLVKSLVFEDEPMLL